MAEPTPCSRYFGSDGKVCATHHGRFLSDTTAYCDKAVMTTLATETREAPTPREPEIERIAAALPKAIPALYGDSDLDPKWTWRHANALYDAGLRFPVPPDPGTAAKVREAPEAQWPHRESTEPPYRLGSPMPCTTCDVPWPCPSQQWVDGLVAAVRAALERFDATTLTGDAHDFRKATAGVIEASPRPAFGAGG